MTDTTRADRLGPEATRRADALRIVRPLLDPHPNAYAQNRDEPIDRLDGADAAHLAQLAEYVLTGEHWSLKGDAEDDEPAPATLGPQITITAPRQAGKSTAHRAALEQFAAGLAEDEQADPIGAHVDDVLGEAYEAARIDPRTHREPNRRETLIDREGDAWQYVEGEGWHCPGETTPEQWHERDGALIEYAPFTIKGAHPNVARELAKWRPGQHGEPPRDAVLVDAHGREWQFAKGREQWVIERHGDGRPISTGAGFKWATPNPYGHDKTFTIKAAGQ